MSISSDYQKLNSETFGRSVVKHHDMLNPIITSKDNLEVFQSEASFKRAIESLLALVKSQKLKLDWFKKQI